MKHDPKVGRISVNLELPDAARVARIAEAEQRSLSNAAARLLLAALPEFEARLGLDTSQNRKPQHQAAG